MCFYKILTSLPIPSTATSYLYTAEELREIGNHAQQNARHNILPLEAIKPVYKLRINKRKIFNGHRKVYKQNGINHKNLTYVRIMNNNGTEATTTVRLMLLNARSIKNK